MTDAYQYKAFISYRHHDFDKRMAEKLQRKLESYKPPKDVAPQTRWKVFRDETELSTHANLSDKIKEALESSEYLIVVCSESLKQSKWCMEEINHFKELHNGSTEKIIPFIVSGTPEEVFPEAILTSAVLNTATGEYEQRPVEPLAANIAAPGERESVKRFKTEFFRIAAPLLSCSFDSLYHRERKRRRRKTRAVAAVVLAAASLFSIYSTAMMMTISSQNQDLEQKNNALTTKTNELNESNANLSAANLQLDQMNTDLIFTNGKLDSTNSQLRSANTELDNANAKLTSTNKELDDANAKLTSTNQELDDANTQLTNTNKELDETNTKLTDANKELDNANTKLTNANKELDNANSKLTNANKELDDSNAQLTTANKELDESNAKLTTANKELDESNAKLTTANNNLDKSNKDLALKTQEALDNLAKAEEQERLAKEAQQQAEALRDQAEANYNEAERQRKIAEEQRDIAEDNLNKLMQANADLTAEKADTQFSERRDRLGAIETLYSTPLYQNDPYALKPSARLFLNKVLYSFCPDSTQRLQRSLDAQTPIVDFSVSTDLRHVIAYDTLDCVYVFEIESGSIVFQRSFDDVCAAVFSDNNHICVADVYGVYSISFTDGKTKWSHDIWDLSQKKVDYLFSAAFSDNKKRLAIWDTNGWFGFLNTDTGDIYYSYRASVSVKNYKRGNTIDFSDGVHLHITGILDAREWYFSIDSEAHSYKSKPIGTDEIRAARHIEGGGSAAVRYETETGATVLDIYNSKGSRSNTITLYNRLIRDTDIKTVFTAWDGNQYAVVTGVQTADRQPVLYLVNLTAGEVARTYTTPSPVMLASYSENGNLTILTAQGGDYGYRVSDGYCKLNSVLSDNQSMNADGSQKMVRPANWITVVLASNTSRLMIYQGGYGDNSAAVSNGNRHYSVMAETDSYVAAESNGSLLVYNKNSKNLLRTIPVPYGISQIKAYESNKVAIVSQDETALHIIDLSSGKDTVRNISKYSEDDSPYRILLVSNDKKHLAVVATDVVMVLENDNVRFKFFDKNILCHFRYGLAALSPDGTKLAKTSLFNNDILEFSILDLTTGQDITLFRTEYQGDFELNRTRVAFSPDGSRVALALNNSVYLFDANNMTQIGTLLSASPIHSIMLDDAYLFALTETSRLEKYNLQTLSREKTLVLPEIIDIKNVSVTTMMLNPTRNELIVYNNTYAGFVDIDAMETVAEATDEYILKVMGFLPSKQELVILKELDAVELRFYPNYTAEELAEQSLALIAAND